MRNVIAGLNVRAGEGPSSRAPSNHGDVILQMNPAHVIATVGPTAVVPQALTESNYEYWSTCIKSYLLAQDLWEICTMEQQDIPDESHDSVWRMKNAMALHAIQVSCSSEVLWRIMRIESAREAWNNLEQFANPNLARDVSTGDAWFDYLRKAIMRGNLQFIDASLFLNPDAVRANIGSGGQTPLHCAVLSGHVNVMKYLLTKLNGEDLGRKESEKGYTPLALAVVFGITEIVEPMIHMNPSLANITDGEGILPVVRACNQGDKDMTDCLYSVTQLDTGERAKNGASLLSYCIVCKFTDIALKILQDYPELALTLDVDGATPLYRLAGRPALFEFENQPWFWQRWVYSSTTVNIGHASHHVRVPVINGNIEQSHGRCSIKALYQLMHGLVSFPLALLGIKNIRAQKLRHEQAKEMLRRICTILNDEDLEKVHRAVMLAVKKGNVKFVIEIIKTIPDLLLQVDENERNIFSIAVRYRQEKIFNLLFNLPNKKFTCTLDSCSNTMLHLAAMLAPLERLEGISGAALQMQREMQWFKEVEKIVPPIFKEALNSDGKTPKELFSEKHANLAKEGEKWMKDMATSSSVVAALMVTMTFAAGFTVPGGNKEDEGVPISLKNTGIMVFIISDSISLFSATASVLMFLGILTSGYAENKFLMKLPTKLIIGLLTLFISIAAMTVAFCAAIGILLKESSTKVVMVLIVSLAAIPVMLFPLMQFPLLFKVIASTFGPGIFNRKIQPWF